jgi:hypothetical protein
LFILTHAVLILDGLANHLWVLPEVVRGTHTAMARDVSQIGALAVFLLFMRAYSLGAGNYTGIEAVSNGLQILKEPRFATAKRTMAYMALSLAFMAGGILVCYLLWHASPQEGGP